MKIVAQGFWILLTEKWEEKYVCLFSWQYKSMDMTDLGRCCFSNSVVKAPFLIQQQDKGTELAIR